MSKAIVDVMVEGGQAKAGAALAQPLAPLGVNLPDIVAQINDKTASFNGMKVPVKVTVDTESKEFDLEIGTPPISELIKKELKIDKASGIPNKTKVGNLSMEQIVKLVQMKKESLLFNNLKSAVKSVIGSCNSAGVLVESKISKNLNVDIEAGKFDDIINNEKTEITPEKTAELAKQLKIFQDKITKEAAKEEAEKLAEEEAAKKAAEAVEPPKEKVKESEEDKAKESEEGKEGETPAEGEKKEESPKDGKKE